jgi:hypothetical protein
LQQRQQFGFRHRPPLPSPVALHFGLGDASQRIRGESFGLNAPLAEPAHRLQVRITSPCRHPYDLSSRQPRFQHFDVDVDVDVDVAERADIAIGEQPVALAFHVVNVRGGRTLSSDVIQIRSEVIGNRRRLMISHRRFTLAQHFAFDQFSPAFQFTEYASGDIFITAAG